MTHKHFIGDEADWLENNWRRCLVSPIDMVVIPRSEAHALFCGGIYFLWADETALLYIGISGDISCRIRAHIAAKRIPFTHVSAIEVWPNMIGSERMMQYLEAAFVHELLPPYNSIGCPSMHKSHAALRQEIPKLWVPIDPTTHPTT